MLGEKERKGTSAGESTPLAIAASPNLYVSPTFGTDALNGGAIILPFKTIDYAMQRIDGTGPFAGFGALTNKTVVILEGTASTANNIYRNTINFETLSGATISYTGADYLIKNDAPTASNTLRLTGAGRIISSTGGIIKLVTSSATVNRAYVQDTTLSVNADINKAVVDISGNSTTGNDIYFYNSSIFGRAFGTKNYGIAINASGGASVLGFASVFNCNNTVQNDSIRINDSGSINTLARTQFIACTFTGTIVSSHVRISGYHRYVIFFNNIFVANPSTPASQDCAIKLIHPTGSNAAMFSDFTLNGNSFSAEFNNKNILVQYDNLGVLTTYTGTGVSAKVVGNFASFATVGKIVLIKSATIAEGEGESIQNDYNATAAPDGNYSSVAGWSVGSQILYTDPVNGDLLYICTNATPGAVVWKCINALS